MLPARPALLALVSLALAVGACAGQGIERIKDTAERQHAEAAARRQAAADPGQAPDRPVPVAAAELRTPDGATVGQVVFSEEESGAIRAAVEIRGLEGEAGFHGLHVHANDDPSNGEGCEANPLAPPDTWFLSADGHLTTGSTHAGTGHAGGEDHPAHPGDLPPVLVGEGGSASAESSTDRLAAEDLAGTAVILHADPDNLGNVPTGAGPEGYRPNGPEAQELTEESGNAGDRIACGVIESGGGGASSSA